MAEKASVERNFRGCMLSPKDIRDYRFKKKAVKAMAVVFPDEFSLEKVAKIKDQGMVGSCVAHATSSILEYHNKNTQKMSTNFLYGIHYRLFKSKGPGMYLNEACKIIKNYGDMIYEDCPDNTEVEKVYSIASTAFEVPEKLDRASRYKIKCFANAKTPNDIKYALMNHGPVLGCVKWFNNYDIDKNTGFIWFDHGSDFGYHATVVLGWTRDGWICQNSWGRYWGNKGYYILPYEDGLAEAYSIVKADDTQDDVKKPCLLVRKLSGIINKILNK